ncbi:hypothetical protein [Streptomyces chartreusis]
MTSTRTFTLAELSALGVPYYLDAAVRVEDTQIDSTPSTQTRRVLFRHDGRVWAAQYRASQPGHPAVEPFEVGPVALTPMTERAVLEKRWIPATSCDSPATLDGGHALIIEVQDNELHGRCQCGIPLEATPLHKPLDQLAESWARHALPENDR